MKPNSDSIGVVETLHQIHQLLLTSILNAVVAQNRQLLKKAIKQIWKTVKWRCVRYNYIMSGQQPVKDQKTANSISKVTTSVFWAAYGILFIDHLEKDKTINGIIRSTVYIESKIKRLYIKKKRKCCFTKTSSMSQVDKKDG